MGGRTQARPAGRGGGSREEERQKWCKGGPVTACGPLLGLPRPAPPHVRRGRKKNVACDMYHHSPARFHRGRGADEVASAADVEDATGGGGSRRRWWRDPRAAATEARLGRRRRRGLIINSPRT